jgi:hypothetical protein
MGLDIGGELTCSFGKSPLVLAFLIAVAKVAVSLPAKKFWYCSTRMKPFNFSLSVVIAHD